MNLTYVLGAGASANALPLVKDMYQRIEIFINHLDSTGLLNEDEKKHLSGLLDQLRNHYTIDTYARKLFLKRSHFEKDLNQLYNLIGAYFIYEQLRKNSGNAMTKFLFDRATTYYDDSEPSKVYKSVIEGVDYRYDSFFAALLKNDENGGVYLPKNINIISWNYDFQLEVSYLNFLVDSLGLDEIQKNLNIYPNPLNDELAVRSSIIKINGTAGFYDDKKMYGELFDFKKDSLDDESMKLLKKILFQKDNYKHLMYFAWNEDTITNKARTYARNILSRTDTLVVIGYSFPYFNRDTDKYIFSMFGKDREIPGRAVKAYIQTKDDTFESIKRRAIGVHSAFKHTEAFTELDQFLIPSEL